MRAALLAGCVLAAGPAAAQPVSGLYIGAGSGANFMQKDTAKAFTYGTGVTTSATGTSIRDTGTAAVASVGWALGNGLRFELEGAYRHNRVQPSDAAGIVSDGGREQKFGPMVNVLFDLDIGSPYVFPYIGGGAGYMWDDRRRNTSGALGFLTPFGAAGGVHANSFTSGVQGSFAYQAIAGLSFPIPRLVGLSLTAEYRYFALAGDRSYNQVVTGTNLGTFSRTLKVTDNHNHALLLGLRYVFDVPPPPVR